MAKKDDAGDRTEKPTDKKLREARKKGDVHKSKEVTSTVGLIVWLVLGALLIGYISQQFAALINVSLESINKPFEQSALQIANMGIRQLMIIMLMLLIPVVLVALIAEFLQAGPVFTGEKIKPDMERLNPVEGFKRMFGRDNLVEVAKAIGKAIILMSLAWVITKGLLAQFLTLPKGDAQDVGAAFWEGSFQLAGWAVVIFAVIAVLDALYQRYSYMEKMKMSIRDIRDELKETEGDPYVKAHRKGMHRDWAENGAVQSARDANVLVVNPTHVAIALAYDGKTYPIPVVIGKGEDSVAMEMRAEARNADVPILRHVPLARKLLTTAEIGEVVPAETFELVAQAILWARSERERLQKERDEREKSFAARRLQRLSERIFRR